MNYHAMPAGSTAMDGSCCSAAGCAPALPLNRRRFAAYSEVSTQQRKEVIQCLIPSAVTSLGSPAKLLSLALGRSQRLDQRVTKVGTRREQSRRVFIYHSRCAIARRGCPESIRPVVAMDSGLARACHRAAQSADPLARPGMTALGIALRASTSLGRPIGLTARCAFAPIY
jgi:hypothetical protein